MLKAICFGTKNITFAIDNCFIRNSIISEWPLIISHINSCALFDNNIYFCWTYNKSLLLKNQPKFGIFNSLFDINYQFYLPKLPSFFIAKTSIIACTYLIIFIVKWRSFKAFYLVAYSYIKSHRILFLQNPASL